MPKDRILQDMLDDVSSNYDKRTGSFIYDAIAPAAEQIVKLGDRADEVEKKLSIDNLTGSELEQRVLERSGIRRRPATKAIGTATLKGSGTVRRGDAFETEEGTRFIATETKRISGSGTVQIEAVDAGSAGVVAAGTITLFPITLSGLTDVINNEPTQDGFDAETDEDLLQRYYEHIQTPATSGNKSHYKMWAKEVPGVGEARIIPLWDGDNTVKVIIIDANRQPASEELVDTVQGHIDPGITGQGNGQAPIGAFATVVSAEGVDINVSVTVTVSEGITAGEIEPDITESISGYLSSIAFVEGIVSFARVGAAILATEGVEDYDSLTINGSTSNVSIGDDEIGVLGEVDIDVT